MTITARLTLKAMLLPVLLLTKGCITFEKKDGLQSFAVDLKKPRTYYLSPKAKKEWKVSFHMALAYWNHELGRKVLKHSRSQKNAHVHIQTRPFTSHDQNGGHTDLLGCHKSYDQWLPCQITLYTLDENSLFNEFDRIGRVFAKGPMDRFLLERLPRPIDPEEYLLIKYHFVTLAHEMGHTLGLMHTDQNHCLMSVAPRGDTQLCKEEIDRVLASLTFP